MIRLPAQMPADFDASGNATTVVDDVPVSKRVRVPGTTGLSTARAALSRPVYVGDTISGGASNASALAYQRPCHMWLTGDHTILRQGDTNVPARLAVTHPFGRNGKPVAAVTGSVYLRSTGGAGTTYYVKESSPTTTTGWVGK